MNINNIQVYDITPNALEYYRKNARRGANSELEAVKRKLSALIYNSMKSEKLDEEITLYYYNRFRMYVNETDKIIIWTYWKYDENEGRWLHKYEQQDLTKTFKLLGLSSTGNSIINN